MKGGKNIAYYHCTHKAGCGKYTEQIEMEDKIAEKFIDLEFAPEFVALVIEKVRTIFNERHNDYERRRKGLVNQRTALEARKTAMQDKLFDGLISDADFTESRNKVGDELASIDAQLHELEKGQDAKMDIAQEILAFTRNIHDTYQKAPPLLKRHYLGFFWKKFEVQDGVIITSHPSQLFEELQKLQKVYYKSVESVTPCATALPSDVIIKDLLLRR